MRLIQKIYEMDPYNVSQVPRPDAYIGVHRGQGCHQKDTQTSRSVGEEGPTAAQNQSPTAKCPYR